MKNSLKKIISFILVVTSICFLCGCGKSDEAKVAEYFIEKIGEVTLESSDSIEVARSCYDSLTEQQQREVSNYSVLSAAEKKYEELKVEQMSSLVGVWEGEIFGIKMVYEFMDDGTFKNYAQASSTAISIKGLNGTYTFDGKNVSMIASNGNESQLTVSLAGDRMIVTVPYSDKSMDVIFSRVK